MFTLVNIVLLICNLRNRSISLFVRVCIGFCLTQIKIDYHGFLNDSCQKYQFSTDSSRHGQAHHVTLVRKTFRARAAPRL